MQRHKSAIKSHRQSLKRHAGNQAVRSRLRTLVKKVRLAIEQKSVPDAAARLREAARALDQAVAKGVVHRNNASRKISRLASQVARLG